MKKIKKEQKLALEIILKIIITLILFKIQIVCNNSKILRIVWDFNGYLNATKTLFAILILSNCLKRFRDYYKSKSRY